MLTVPIRLSTSAFAAEADNFTAYKLDVLDQTEALNTLVNKKIALAEEEFASENQKAEKKQPEGPSTATVVGKSVIKVLTSATFIRGVFGVLNKMFKK